jgi:hypothetical protein
VPPRRKSKSPPKTVAPNKDAACATILPPANKTVGSAKGHEPIRPNDNKKNPRPLKGSRGAIAAATCHFLCDNDAIFLFLLVRAGTGRNDHTRRGMARAHVVYGDAARKSKNPQNARKSMRGTNRVSQVFGVIVGKPQRDTKKHRPWCDRAHSFSFWFWLWMAL